MSRILSRHLIAARPLAVGFTLLYSQQPKPAATQDQTGTVFRANTRMVVCHTTVVDKSGHLVTNLTESAFNVFENEVKQQIKVFKHEDLPVSLGLIIDNSGSMRPKRAKVEAAALALVKDSNPDDEVFVVNFNDTAYLDNPHGKLFTSDIAEMEEALTRIDSRGGTAMRDAVQMSIDHLVANAHKDKKVLVLVTDGVENASTISKSLEELVRNARQSEVLIYAVGLLTDEEKREAAAAKRQLNALTQATGGESFYPKEVSEVESIAHLVAHDIRNQYTIEYSPSNSELDGTYRRIRVAVKAPGNPTPRTRTGYFATEQPAPKGT